MTARERFAAREEQLVMQMISGNFRWVALATLLGALLIPGVAMVTVMASASRQVFSEVPEGIRIEALASAPELPFGPGDTTAVLFRYSYAPGASLEVPYVGPVLVYVESGTLTLDAVGEDVELLYAENVVENPLSGEPISRSQVGEVNPVGGRATLEAGGSAYASAGDLGLTRNAATGELVLLVVQFVSEPEPTDVTRIPVEPPPD
jgi:hypothetical protein